MENLQAKKKLKLAVWKFASCDGCQLSLLDCEDELLSLTQHIEIAYFLEASKHFDPGPYDLSLVEGSISTQSDIQRIQDIRAHSQKLITIGACANAGGIQALRNGRDINEFIQYVYPNPKYIDTLAHSTPIAQHVRVDFELQGCPINKYQLLEVCKSMLLDKRPSISSESVCVECKLKGNTCIMVTNGTACLGPVTHAGCGALCPSYHRGCYGCYGPKETAHPTPLAKWFKTELKYGDQHILRLLQNFNAQAPEFSQASKPYKDEK